VTSKIYVDVLFIDNLVMNYILLWVCAKAAKIRPKWWRMLCGALLGAAYAIIVFSPYLVFFNNISMKILLSILIIIICFPITGIPELLKLVMIFYMVTFIFGGAAFGLFYFFKKEVAIINGAFYIKEFPIKTLVLTSVIAYIIFEQSWGIIKKRRLKDNYFVSIEVVFDGASKVIRALIDTGNSLCDPVTRMPVMVVHFKALKQLLPEEVQRIYTEGIEENLYNATNIIANSSWVYRFRIIPFTSLGREKGILIGFKPDKVYMVIEKGKKELENIIVGVYNRPFSMDNDYDALLHPEIIS
jgi:stage II sporulation protein GA (sporulation sigma-E factor processing peptidase)